MDRGWDGRMGGLVEFDVGLIIIIIPFPQALASRSVITFTLHWTSRMNVKGWTSHQMEKNHYVQLESTPNKNNTKAGWCSWPGDYFNKMLWLNHIFMCNTQIQSQNFIGQPWKHVCQIQTYDITHAHRNEKERERKGNNNLDIGHAVHIIRIFLSCTLIYILICYWCSLVYTVGTYVYTHAHISTETHMI